MSTTASPYAHPQDLNPLLSLLSEHGPLLNWDAEQDLLDAIALAYGLSSHWSCGAPPSQLAERAFEGQLRLRYRAHWGESGEVASAPMADPTWLMLWAAADQAIELSGDAHHVFIESFILCGPFIELSTGS